MSIINCLLNVSGKVNKRDQKWKSIWTIKSTSKYKLLLWQCIISLNFPHTPLRHACTDLSHPCPTLIWSFLHFKLHLWYQPLGWPSLWSLTHHMLSPFLTWLSLPALALLAWSGFPVSWSHKLPRQGVTWHSWGPSLLPGSGSAPGAVWIGYF